MKSTLSSGKSVRVISQDLLAGSDPKLQIYSIFLCQNPETESPVSFHSVDWCCECEQTVP